MLMDKFHLIRLLRCAYPDRLLGNTGSTDDAGGIVFLNAESENEEHVDDSFATSGKVTFAYLKFRGEIGTGEMHIRPNQCLRRFYMIYLTFLMSFRRLGR
jgi:hypothetical protein